MNRKSQKRNSAARKSGEPVSYPQSTFSCRMNDERIEEIKDLYQEFSSKDKNIASMQDLVYLAVMSYKTKGNAKTTDRLIVSMADEVNSIGKYIEEFSDRVRFLEMEVNRLRGDRNL